MDSCANWHVLTACGPATGQTCRHCLCSDVAQLLFRPCLLSLLLWWIFSALLRLLFHSTWQSTGHWRQGWNWWGEGKGVVLPLTSRRVPRSAGCLFSGMPWGDVCLQDELKRIAWSLDTCVCNCCFLLIDDWVKLEAWRAGGLTWTREMTVPRWCSLLDRLLSLVLVIVVMSHHWLHECRTFSPCISPLNNFSHHLGHTFSRLLKLKFENWH